MRPLPVARCMMRPRCHTIRTASSSESTPATYSAANSPMLWPTTAAGSTPQERQSAANATCTAKTAGSASSVSCRRDTSAGAASAAESDQPGERRKRASRSASVSRNTGSTPTARSTSAPIAGLPAEYERQRGAPLAGRCPTAALRKARQRRTRALTCDLVLVCATSARLAIVVGTALRGGGSELRQRRDAVARSRPKPPRGRGARPGFAPTGSKAAAPRRRPRR